jgi:hypothetical protein
LRRSMNGSLKERWKLRTSRTVSLASIEALIPMRSDWRPNPIWLTGGFVQMNGFCMWWF